MTHPYNKRDEILERDLTAAERLEPARATLLYATRLLQQFHKDLMSASDNLTENQLEIICNAVDQAWMAAENCAFMGLSGFNAHPLKTVKWER